MKLRPWFFSVLRNVIIDIHRQDKSIKKGLDSIQEDLEIDLFNKDVTDICCDLEGFFLKLLDPEDEALIKAVNLEGMSISEYSKKFDISEGTVRVRKHRALDRLKKKVLKICKCFENSNLDSPKRRRLWMSGEVTRSCQFIVRYKNKYYYM